MVSFNQIPSALRVPFSYVEFSNSESSSGSTVQQYKIMLLGVKLAAGTALANVPVRIQSEQQARTAFGPGSQLFHMAKASLKANNFTETWAIPLAEDAAGVKATGQLTITGPATADGTLALYIAGKAYFVPVLSGDSATAIAATAISIISADGDRQMDAVVNGSSAFKVDLTAKTKGIYGNYIDIRTNYYGEALPGGVGVTITAATGGTVNPSLATALSAIGDDQYRCIGLGLVDAANLALVEAELATRWGPLLTNDGHAFAATSLGLGGAQTLGLSRNSPFLSIVSAYGSPTAPWQIAATSAAVAAYYSAIDPARPLQTLPLPGVLPASPQSRLQLSERNTLLFSGISTTTVDSGGIVRIEKMITTYKTDTGGNPDESYLAYERLATLSYLRFDFRAYFGRKYPRHKLGNDGTNYAPGSAVMTPLLAKAECVALFRNWEELGLVEDADQFKRDLIVERNPLNPDRLDFYLPPNLINALSVIAAQIAFRQ